MKIFKNPELKGILAIVLAIFVIAVALMATNGKLEQWFGITWFSGPQALDKIVFISDRAGGADIYSMNTDGSKQEALTEKAEPDCEPAISVNGNKILFASNKGGTSQIYCVGGRGGSPIQITTATGSKSCPAFNPDGKVMSYIASGKVYVADLTGDKPDPVLPTREEIHAVLVARSTLPSYSAYAWGPDGASMAGVTQDGNGNDMLVYLPDPEKVPVRIPFERFISMVDKTGKITKMLIDTKDQRGIITHVVWATQKSLLAVSGTVGKTSFLAVVDIENGRISPITIQKNIQFSRPAVAADGSAIVVGVKGLGQASLIAINLSNGRPVTVAKGEFEDLSLSPKGDKLLATQVTSSGNRDIVVINTTTAKLTRLTTDGHSYSAIWTPVSETEEDHDHEGH